MNAEGITNHKTKNKMSTSSKKTVVNVFTALVVFITAFQGVIPTMPITNQATVTLISAVVMFLVSALTLWKQYLSVEIDNKSILPTVIVTIVATLGLLNQFFDVVNVPGIVGQWIRFGLTFITMGLNLLSKILWPTPETTTKI